MPVVILYESRHQVGKAVATYHHLVRELSEDIAPDFHLWRLDVAVEPACAAEAERDLAAAGVIIVAVNGDRPCPPVFQRWQGGRDGKAGPSSCAIIALVEASEDPAPCPGSWRGILRQAATQIHPEVFVWNPPMLGNNGFGPVPSGPPANPAPTHKP